MKLVIFARILFGGDFLFLFSKVKFVLVSEGTMFSLEFY